MLCLTVFNAAQHTVQFSIRFSSAYTYTYIVLVAMGESQKKLTLKSFGKCQMVFLDYIKLIYFPILRFLYFKKKKFGRVGLTIWIYICRKKGGQGWSIFEFWDFFISKKKSLVGQVWQFEFALMGFSYICRKKGDSVQLYISIYLSISIYLYISAAMEIFKIKVWHLKFLENVRWLFFSTWGWSIIGFWDFFISKKKIGRVSSTIRICFHGFFLHLQKERGTRLIYFRILRFLYFKKKKVWSGKFDNLNLLWWAFLTFAETKGTRLIYFRIFIFLYFKKFGRVSLTILTCFDGLLLHLQKERGQGWSIFEFLYFFISKKFGRVVEEVTCQC